jgi:hypothetical protein
MLAQRLRGEISRCREMPPRESRFKELREAGGSDEERYCLNAPLA